MEESVEPISLVDYSKAYHDVDRYMDIWDWLVYTGYVIEDLLENEIQKELLSLIDVLIDGKFVKELYSPNLKWKGSANQRVIDVKKSIAQNEIVLYDA